MKQIEVSNKQDSERDKRHSNESRLNYISVKLISYTFINIVYLFLRKVLVVGV